MKSTVLWAIEESQRPNIDNSLNVEPASSTLLAPDSVLGHNRGVMESGDSWRTVVGTVSLLRTVTYAENSPCYPSNRRCTIPLILFGGPVVFFLHLHHTFPDLPKSTQRCHLSSSFRIHLSLWYYFSLPILSHFHPSITSLHSTCEDP